MSTPSVSSTAGHARWSRVSRLLGTTLATLTVALLAVEVVTVVAGPVRGNPAAGFAAVVTAAAGFALGGRNVHAGVLLTAAGPLLAASLGWDPTVAWAVCGLTAMRATLRGAPALLAAPVLGGASLAAAGFATVPPPVEENAVGWVVATVPVLLAAVGSAVRGKVQYWAELEQRALDAAAARHAAVTRSLAEERVRIARDLHDSVGHHIAVVSMHLGSAQVHLPPAAQESRVGLEAARVEVQAVLRETQQILRVLRADEADDDAPSRDPRPATARIGDLVAVHRAAGMTIEATVPDLDSAIPTGIAEAVYRVVQESLTNARRHGDGNATLTVTRTDSSLAIEVTNGRPVDRPPSTASGGFGLPGMRDRVESAGGRLTVQDGGTVFRVRAELPVGHGALR